ncbi:histidinol-phosphatase HisJ family protein [Metaclostridioides mangenotii]|uniref:histidinol-phosphatase HisJ family protein n=1 Tax=Metaclostridioides mangenotii TaxID=1540 RepID=UPI0028E8660C|nr:histidinol-phosphatase HisJ family protein [Clostridioides mangenotii]
MYKADSHVHTRFSNDGRDHIYKMIERAIDLGVKYLTLTDHLEYNKDKFSLDFNNYINKILECKEKYKNEINLLTGVEVGYQRVVKDEIDVIINSYPFDFVLCSTHTIDNKHVSRDEYFENLTQLESYTKYYESIVSTVREYNNFDIYGHLDYVRRYGQYRKSKYVYDDYKNILDEVLKEILLAGKGIEINTSGYRYKVDSTHPSIEVLKRYKELGGEIITIGSDAHRSEDICRDFDKVYEILNYIGYKYICIYEDRKPKFLKIGEKFINVGEETIKHIV